MQNQAPADQSSGDDVAEIINPEGAAALVLVCDHASNAINPNYAFRGLTAAVVASHAAWDPGALDVARGMAAVLNAPVVAARVSRLVYDCNRPSEAPAAMPVRSEIYDIPGNRDLDPGERRRRVESIYHPFHAAVAATLDRQAERSGRPPMSVTVHSFTPVFHGRSRAVEVGVLHESDARLADALLASPALGPDSGLVIRRNQPYGPADGVTHTLRRHGVARGGLNVMIEIRNDLIADADGQAALADRLSEAIRQALGTLSVDGRRAVFATGC